jgi:hypothetical protein
MWGCVCGKAHAGELNHVVLGLKQQAAIHGHDSLLFETRWASVGLAPAARGCLGVLGVCILHRVAHMISIDGLHISVTLLFLRIVASAEKNVRK